MVSTHSAKTKPQGLTPGALVEFPNGSGKRLLVEGCADNAYGYPKTCKSTAL